MGVRIFLVDDNDSVRRFPVRFFDRLNTGDPTATVPELAGKRVRYALAVVDTQQRRVAGVRALQCGFLQFDQSGRLDEQAQREETRLAMEMLPDFLPKKEQTSVRNAAHLFAQRAFAHRYKWEPSETVLRQIAEALFRS
jgi:hypothetical protein